MSATTVIELDTESPVVTFGDAVQDGSGNIVVSYTVDKPGVQISASLFIGDQELEVTVLPDTLVAALPTDSSVLAGLVSVVATDDVLNDEVYTLPVKLIGKFARMASAVDQFPGLVAEHAEDPRLLTKQEDVVTILSKLDGGA